jgi:hypothetical protein
VPAHRGTPLEDVILWHLDAWRQRPALRSDGFDLLSQCNLLSEKRVSRQTGTRHFRWKK